MRHAHIIDDGVLQMPIMPVLKHKGIEIWLLRFHHMQKPSLLVAVLLARLSHII